MREPNFLTIAEASDLIAQRKLSPVEVAQACLDRLDDVDDQLNSFITVTGERALEEAKAAEAEIMRGGPRSAMHGIPFCLKDIYETAGVRTTGQSRLLADNVPDADCDAQDRLRRAGGVLMGKTTTWEFAHGGPSWDVVAPPARNPWNTDHHPAGSSSGSGAAVAAGICPATMGTDTGGSIRLPAAVCGIAGIKPTYGRVSRRGVLPNCFSHDYCGPMAWTTEDVAILLGIVAGHDPRDPSSAREPVPDYRAALSGDVTGLTIGVPYRWLDEQAPASPEVRAAFDASLDVFRSLGAHIRSIELPPLELFDDAKKTIAMSELFTIHEKDLRTRPHLFGASLRYRIICGGLIRAEDYIQAMRMRLVLAQEVQAAFGQVDLVMLPTAEPAGRLEVTPHNWLFKHKGWTTAFNVSGNPALSVCNGFATNGMPLSLQIVGRLFDEATVLRAGDAFEKATPWRDRRPVLSAKVDA